MSDLQQFLNAASCLIDSSLSRTSDTFSRNDLPFQLISRLSKCREVLGIDTEEDSSVSKDEAQWSTAEIALTIIERINDIMVSNTEGSIVGTRDLASLRTLLSIIFKWGLQPQLTRMYGAWPGNARTSSPISSNIIDLTDTPSAHQRLCALSSRMMAILLSPSTNNLKHSWITVTLLNKHLPDLLSSFISLGWLPQSLSNATMPTISEMRPQTMTLLAKVPASEAIVALGAILSSSEIPKHVYKTCTFLLSRQLLRPDGIQGLLSAVYGDTASSMDAPLEKLERVSKVLSTVPSGMKAEDYFNIVVPRTLELLSDSEPPSHRRAAAFSVSRFLAGDQPTASSVTLGSLHQTFLQAFTEFNDSSGTPSASKTLSQLTSFVTNADPSPEANSTVFGPIVASLYSLLEHLSTVKTSDPSIKEHVNGLLLTWAKLADKEEALSRLWSIIEGEHCTWTNDMDSGLRRSERQDKFPKTSMLTPNDVEKELDMNSNIFDLFPDPQTFVSFIKNVGRGDVSSELFIRILESYQGSRKGSDEDPTRSLLYLQLTIQMRNNLSEGESTILGRPAVILSFIKHVLDSATPQMPLKPSHDSFGLKNLQIVSDPASDEDDDSDDELDGSERYSRDDEMVETSLNLLLSLLEGDPNLSARNTPVLSDIFASLEYFVTHGISAVQSLAREASLVLTARLASEESPRRSEPGKSKENDTQEKYQNALRLLQDPIVPVRAHGLLLLRQLVSPASSNGKVLEPALVPAVLSIFLQVIRDDDSYMFLNSVQGLAAMVDGYGTDVLKSLVGEYTKSLDGLGGMDMTQQDLDVRTRIGEALAIVIRRCGQALVKYVDMLIPRIFNVVRLTHIPTTLRTSALSLLSECVNTNATALFAYVTDLADAMIDLLQIEGSLNTDLGEATIIDATPESNNPKFPPFRRAALHLLTIMVRETAKDLSDSRPLRMLDTSFKQRAKLTLSYTATTDRDPVVKIMAREAHECLEDLEKVSLGL